MNLEELAEHLTQSSIVTEFLGRYVEHCVRHHDYSGLIGGLGIIDFAALKCDITQPQNDELLKAVRKAKDVILGIGGDR